MRKNYVVSLLSKDNEGTPNKGFPVFKMVNAKDKTEAMKMAFDSDAHIGVLDVTNAENLRTYEEIPKLETTIHADMVDLLYRNGEDFYGRLGNNIANNLYPPIVFEYKCTTAEKMKKWLSDEFFKNNTEKKDPDKYAEKMLGAIVCLSNKEIVEFFRINAVYVDRDNSDFDEEQIGYGVDYEPKPEVFAAACAFLDVDLNFQVEQFKTDNAAGVPLLDWDEVIKSKDGSDEYEHE